MAGEFEVTKLAKGVYEVESFIIKKTTTGIDFYFGTTKIAELDQNGNLKIKGEVSVLQSF